MKHEIIGHNIKKYREHLGLTQKQLASELGISSARLSNWETGINRPDVEMLAKLCVILNISANMILEIDQPEQALSAEAVEISKAYDEASPEICAAVRALLHIADPS